MSEGIGEQPRQPGTGVLRAYEDGKCFQVNLEFFSHFSAQDTWHFLSVTGLDTEQNVVTWGFQKLHKAREMKIRIKSNQDLWNQGLLGFMETGFPGKRKHRDTTPFPIEASVNN